MSSFFSRAMILLLIFDLILPYDSIYYDGVSEYEVISLEKKNFRFISIMDVTPFRASSVIKFEQFVAVSCSYWTMFQDGSTMTRSHIRIYEDKHHFNLLFVINMDNISAPFDMAWNKMTQNLFVMSRPTGLWQINWEDHLVKKFSCPPVVTVGFISLSNDGHVLIFGEVDKLLYVCSFNGTLIRKISSVQDNFYVLNATIDVYLFNFAYYDPRLYDRKGFNPVRLHLSEMKDFSVESILDVNRASECNVASANVKRFSFFIMSHVPEKCNEFEVIKVTIERRSKIPMHLAAEYNSSDESLIDEFYSNRGDRFRYSSVVTRCFVPRDSADGGVESKSSPLIVSYSYDSDINQLIAGLSNSYDEDQELFILLLQ